MFAGVNGDRDRIVPARDETALWHGIGRRLPGGFLGRESVRLSADLAGRVEDRTGGLARAVDDAIDPADGEGF